MENYDDIVFFDSEIVDDDEDAPVGTLHSAPDKRNEADSLDDIEEVEELEELGPEHELAHDEDGSASEIAAHDAAPAKDESKTPAPAEAENKPRRTRQPAKPKIVIPKTVFNWSDGAEASPYDDSLQGMPSQEDKKGGKAKKNSKPKQTEAEIALWAQASLTLKRRPSQNKPTQAQDAEPAIDGKDASECANKPQTRRPAAKAEEKKKAPAREKLPEDEPVEIYSDDAQDVEAAAERPENNIPAKKEENMVSNDEEKVLVEGDESKPQHGKFVIKKTDKGNFVYKLFSSNKRVVAVPGGAYKDISSCKGGIQSVINNAGTAPIEDLTLKKPVEQKCPKWEIYADNKGEFRLRLIASNGNVVAITNDGYTGKDAAKKGIDVIARAAQGASIVRNDDLW